MGYKQVTREGVVDAIIGDAYSEVQSLAEEMREWADNMEEKFSQTSKYDDVSSAADTLENISEADLPDDMPAITTAWLETVHKSKKRSPSRAVRASNVETMLRAAEEAIRAHIGHKEPSELIDALSELAEKLSEDADEIAGVEFPGAFGA